MKRCPSNALNPQSNDILEWTYKVLLYYGLIAFDLKGTPYIDKEELDLFEEYLVAVSYAI